MYLVCEYGFLSYLRAALDIPLCLGVKELRRSSKPVCIPVGWMLILHTTFLRRPTSHRKHKSGFVNSDQGALAFLPLQGMWKYLHTLETVLLANNAEFLR